jgi:hypothetical protein
MARYHAKDVKVGDVYVMKVGSREVKVRIDEVVNHKQVRGLGTIGQKRLYRRAKTEWLGTNLVTKRQVRIKSAAKLRRKVGDEQRGVVRKKEEVRQTLDTRRKQSHEEYLLRVAKVTAAFERIIDAESPFAWSDVEMVRNFLKVCAGQYGEKVEPVSGHGLIRKIQEDKLPLGWNEPNGTEVNLSRAEYSRLNHGGLEVTPGDVAAMNPNNRVGDDDPIDDEKNTVGEDFGFDDEDPREEQHRLYNRDIQRSIERLG